MLNPSEALHNLQQFDPKALETNSFYKVRKVRSYNSSQSAVYKAFYNIFTDTLFPVLFPLLFTIYTGECG